MDEWEIRAVVPGQQDQVAIYDRDPRHPDAVHLSGPDLRHGAQFAMNSSSPVTVTRTDRWLPAPKI